jgi:hypothetical protein
MKGLVSTAASRAWLAVALVGFVLVVLVLALSLIPRLGAGQRVIDAAKPAFTNERVAGTRAGVDLVSQYVDVVDPLLTARGGASKEVRSLIRIMRRKMHLSSAQARKILRREAPHTEALTRALPLAGIAGEIPRLTSYLATTMSLSEEQLAAMLERDFPRISQMLTALPNVADGWYDVPGIEGLTRLKGDKPVRTVPGLRKYYRDDIVPLMVEHKQHFQDLAGAGGIGYIAPLLLVAGLALLAYGLLQARRAMSFPPGRRSWSVVAGVGVLIVLIVGAAQYFPRLGGGQKLIGDFEPVFAKERVNGAANGIDTLHEAVLFGDPIATPGGLAADETPQLYRFVADRTGRSSKDVRAALARRAPQTVALLDAIPLTAVAGEVPHLVAYLTRALRMPRDEVVALLHRRTPGLAQSLLTLPAVTAGWNAIPGTEGMRRLDGFMAVRTMPELDDYLRQDLTPVLVDEREDFDSLASTWPPVDRLAPLLLGVGLLLLLYAAVMVRFAPLRNLGRRLGRRRRKRLDE